MPGGGSAAASFLTEGQPEVPPPPPSDDQARALPLPHRDDPALWGQFCAAWEPMPSSGEQLAAAWAKYRPGMPAASIAAFGAAFTGYPGTEEAFFGGALQSAVAWARRLPELAAKEPAVLRTLHQGTVGRRVVPRPLAASLLANMLLGTFQGLHERVVAQGCTAYNAWSFDELLHDPHSPQEVAKLRMFIHYFERVGATAELPGAISIYRCNSQVAAAEWERCEAPLLPVAAAPVREGFESHRVKGCLEADFANAYIGGGVICGGCVQEEIRFAIAPENTIALLFCPYTLPHESIQIVGAQQYAAYSGYGFTLRYAGPHQSAHDSDEDGTPLVAISAIDAVDGRMGFPLAAQMEEEIMLRELNKAHAGFEPADPRFAGAVVATGNWGCGVFGGHHRLKALLQWMAASSRARKMLYFPFEKECLGPDLCALSERFSDRVTVGRLWAVLRGVAQEVRAGSLRCAASEPPRQQDLFSIVAARLA
eukprot:TRINITY_DN18879_c0_g3_i2.p1 TRINITY_DN18879_c0_g3~~TRINITY_DN18879_c0_g3_i2.p1  ORF type:complete len:481 (+),score=108.84 TRINITY_DN18879_c0_g3_i2:90-1532(+)